MNKVRFFKEKNIRIISIYESNENRLDSDILHYMYKNGGNENLDWLIKNLFRILNLPLVQINTIKHCEQILSEYILLEIENSLSKQKPDIAKEWHPILNGELCPDYFQISSGKKVWWICKKCGHEWKAAIAHRTNGRGCPSCAKQNRLITANKNRILKKGSLYSKFPSIAKEWHPIKNGQLTSSDVTCGSNKKVWWLCHLGHEWEETVNNRTNGYSCPYCSNHRVLQNFNDLVTTHPLLAKEWHPTLNGKLTPNDVSFGSGKKVWWKCKNCGYEWQDTINRRTKKKTVCPCCR